jgi:type I restriction enzyme M protein
MDSLFSGSALGVSPLLRNQSIGADPLGRYYTAKWVGQTLVEAINYDYPKLIVELGVGEGVLSSAAMQKWTNSTLVTVDADAKSGNGAKLLNGLKIKHQHHVHDVLDHTLDSTIGVRLGSADVALCNPPYIRPKWRDDFGRILSDAGLSSSLMSIHDAGADLLFLAQNLRLLKSQGKLGVILPDGLITGEKYLGIRKVLLNEHLIEQVIQLPRNAFRGTEAQTYLVILSKESGPTRKVTVRSLGSEIASKVLSISKHAAYQRLDYKFHNTVKKSHVVQVKGASQVSFSSLNIDLQRGTISSNEIQSLLWPVFHLCNFPNNENSYGYRIPKSLRIQKRHLNRIPKQYRIACPGDILLARIGRNLHEKICIVEEGNCIISDCVFRIRVAEEFQEPIIKFLKSEHGQDLIRASAHGVGANYLSRKDVFELYLPSTYLPR